jgi:tungstate transport system ATP-binding protein
MMSKKVILSAKNIAKSYQQEQILDGVDLEIKQGVVGALVGANGSGKTTLLKILSQLEEADRGEIYYLGEQINEENELHFRRQLGFIWQQTLLYNDSVYNNIALGLKFRELGATKIGERVNQILERLKITGLKEKNAKLLSGGQQQKVSIARALVTKPEIIFIDEPNSSLDLESIHLVEKIIREEAARGAGIILITHNFYQAKELGDEILFINHGTEIINQQTKEFFKQRSELLRCL